MIRQPRAVQQTLLAVSWTFEEDQMLQIANHILIHDPRFKKAYNEIENKLFILAADMMSGSDDVSNWEDFKNGIAGKKLPFCSIVGFTNEYRKRRDNYRGTVVDCESCVLYGMAADQKLPDGHGCAIQCSPLGCKTIKCLALQQALENGNKWAIADAALKFLEEIRKWVGSGTTETFDSTTEEEPKPYRALDI